MMRLYYGYRDKLGTAHVRVADIQSVGGAVFTQNNRPLTLRLDLLNKSPTGFEWGHGGSGAAQLALALCADALGSDARALEVFQDFKWSVIGTLDQDAQWILSDFGIEKICERLEHSRARRAI